MKRANTDNTEHENRQDKWPFSTSEVEMARMAKDIEYIKESIKQLEKKLDGNYVTREEFKPVKTIAFGLIGAAASAVLVAAISLVVNKGGV